MVPILYFFLYPVMVNSTWRCYMTTVKKQPYSELTKMGRRLDLHDCNNSLHEGEGDN